MVNQRTQRRTQRRTVKRSTTTALPSDETIAARIAQARAAGKSIGFDYNRLSKIPGDRVIDGESTKRQGDRNRRVAEQRNGEVVATFADDDISAAYDREHEAGPKTRPGFDALIAAIGKHRPDFVASVYGSRLQRNLLEYALLADACARTGTIIVSEIEGELDVRSDEQYLMGAIRALNDAAYVSKIAKGRRSVLADRRDRGLPSTGGRRWYGFDDDKVTPRRDEAEVIVWLASQVLDKSMSLRAMCATLDADGVPTPSQAIARDDEQRELANDRWNVQTVKRMLRRPANCGWLAYKGEPLCQYADVASGAVKPIMTRARFDKVVKVLDGRRRSGTHVSTRTQAGRSGCLSGLLFCDVCGRGMFSVTVVEHEKRKRKYRCARGHMVIGAEAAEEVALATVLRYGSDPKHMHAIAAAAKQRSADWRAARDRLAELDDEVRELAESDLPVDALAARTRKIDRERRELRQTLADADPTPRDTLETVKAETRGRLSRRWQAGDNFAKREMVTDLLVGFTVRSVGKGARRPAHDRMTPLPRA